MKKKSILFRADGNSETGLGHLYRCFALAEMYKKDFDFLFVTSSDSFLEVFPKNYNLVKIPNSFNNFDEVKWLCKNFPSDKYNVILDGYKFSHDYQKKLKDNDYFLVYIDDLISGNQIADIVINHSPLVKSEDYISEKHTKFALGTSYSILRPSFLKSTLQKRTIENLDTCFVCFGGSDYYDLTLKAILALLEVKKILKINAVVGAAYKSKEIFKIEKKHKKLNIYQNISEKKLNGIIHDCNMAIAPSSTISYEICAVKMPFIGGYFTENQKELYKGLINNEVIFDGGNFQNYSKEDFKKLIKQLIDENKISFYIDKQMKLFDSKIKERFLKLLAQ